MKKLPFWNKKSGHFHKKSGHVENQEEMVGKFNNTEIRIKLNQTSIIKPVVEFVFVNVLLCVAS